MCEGGSGGHPVCSLSLQFLFSFYPLLGPRFEKSDSVAVLAYSTYFFVAFIAYWRNIFHTDVSLLVV